MDRHTDMDLPNILLKYNDDIDVVLREALYHGNADILNIMKYHIGWVDKDGNPINANHGKGLRSSLCMFACESIGGRVDAALPSAAAIEIIHNFSLIHDDIQDGDAERRHRPTVWKIWGKGQALQIGNAMRVLGDLAQSLRTAAEIKPEYLVMCNLALTNAYLEMMEGQYLDLYFQGRWDVRVGDYLDMIARKTGALIRNAMALGAIVGGGDVNTVEAMTRCGRYLGYAFQIRDDYLGVWGDERITGKPIGSDILRKKSSLPIVHAIQESVSADRKQISDIYSKELVDSNDIDAIMAVLDKTKSRAYVQGLVEEYAFYAARSLNELDLVPGSTTELDELVWFLTNREY